jgi:hypothetical protein
MTMLSVPIINPEAETGTTCGTCGLWDEKRRNEINEGFCHKHKRFMPEDGMPCFNYVDEEHGLLFLH